MADNGNIAIFLTNGIKLCASVGADPAYPEINIYAELENGDEVDIAAVTATEDMFGVYVWNEPNKDNPGLTVQLPYKDYERSE